MNDGTREPILLSYRPDKVRRGVQNARSRVIAVGILSMGVFLFLVIMFFCKAL